MARTKTKQVKTPRREPLPEFKSREEEALFWETHSPLDYPEAFEEIETPPEVRQRLRHSVTLAFDARTLDRIYELARERGLSSAELIQMWAKERLQEEQRVTGLPRQAAPK